MACDIIRVSRVLTLGSPCRLQNKIITDRLQSASICIGPYASRSKGDPPLILSQGMPSRKSKTQSDRQVPAASLSTDYMIDDDKSTDECNNLPSLIDSLVIDGISPMRRQNPMYVEEAHERMGRMSKRMWPLNSRLASMFMSYCRIATSMAEFYHPEAKLDQFVATSIVYALAFMIDDVFDHPTEEGLEACGLNRGALKNSWSEYLRSLDELLRQSVPPVHPSPLQRMMWDVGQEMQQNSTPGFLNFFVDALLEHHRTYFTSRLDFTKESSSSAHDLDSFTEFRVRDCGGLFTVIILEFANGEFLPDEVREHPFTMEMTKIAIKHALLTNDIFSYSKEVHESGSVCNVMTVLMESLEKLTLPQAAWRAIQMVNAYHGEFMEGERRLREESDGWEPVIENNRTALVRYLARVRELYSGNIYWSSLVIRYRTADAIFPELRHIPIPHRTLQCAPLALIN